MTQPVRYTILFALVSGFLVVPAAELMSAFWTWTVALKLAVWADVALYAILISRWSRTAPWPLVVPLTLLLGAAFWPHICWGYFLFAVGVLAWIRSGMCYTGRPIRALLVETITSAGSVLLLSMLGGRSPMAWALTITLFFLVQSLYFFLVPAVEQTNRVETREDSFERAVEGAEKVLEGSY